MLHWRRRQNEDEAVTLSEQGLSCIPVSDRIFCRNHFTADIFSLDGMNQLTVHMDLGGRLRSGGVQKEGGCSYAGMSYRCL